MGVKKWVRGLFTVPRAKPNLRFRPGLDEFDVRVLPSATLGAAAHAGHAAAANDPVTDPSSITLNVQVDTPILLSSIEGDQGGIFLTGTDEGGLYVQVADYQSGAVSSTLLGAPPGGSTFQIPPTASPNYQLNPNLPTMIWDPSTGSWLTLPPGVGGGPGAGASGFQQGGVNVIVPSNCVPQAGQPAPAAPPKPPVTPVKPAPGTPGQTPLAPGGQSVQVGGTVIQINGNGNIVIISPGGTATQIPVTPGQPPVPQPVPQPAPAPAPLKPPTVTLEQTLPDGTQIIRNPDGSVLIIPPKSPNPNPVPTPK